MSAQAQDQQPSRIVIVVGVDLSNVSEHLLEKTRSLLRPVDEAEVHVVRVIRPEPPLLRLVRPKEEPHAGVVHEVESAQRALERLSASLVHNPQTRVIIHTPIGSPPVELARIAAEVGADLIVIEAHEHDGREPHRVFHRSVADVIASTAPCTVLTLRTPRRASASALTPSTSRQTEGHTFVRG
jgi:nucleotide-binding universal stress UspA family protein